MIDSVLSKGVDRMRISKAELFETLPPEWPEDLLPRIRTQVRELNTKLVVLDDDPTGTQTVCEVPVLTEWSPETLAGVLAEPDIIVYILTNSRSVSLREAQAMNREIAASLKTARKMTGRDFAVVSRSDSTLRGHYPGEVTALVEGLGEAVDGTLIIPFFQEGGRLTIHDVHYVEEGEWLVPAAETDYARDAAFGYRNSGLREWVMEKHRWKIDPARVTGISLSDLRAGGPAAVVSRLREVQGGRICVVDAASYRDMEVLVAGLLMAESEGKRFVYRTAASFVRVRGGLPPRPLLKAADLSSSDRQGGGLLIAGSYIKKSSEQIEALQALPGMTSLEVAVERLLDPVGRNPEVERASRAAGEALAAGKDTLVFTSRRLITGSDEVSSLQIGQVVSQALVDIVVRLESRPAWMIAKGGITSSDVATKGLHIKRAQVLGQAIPGVPVWVAGEGSRWPGLLYVVFPGNVGGPGAIAQMVKILHG
jgi:uncharacterized protein YgbK (DUF1537 family)